MKPCINRALITLKPKKKYLDWARSVGDGKEVDEVKMEDFCNAYLIGEIDSSEKGEIRKNLGKYWREIAAEEFEAWWMLEDDWPELRSIKDFEEYFDWTFTELVMDLLDDVLEKDDEDDFI